MFRDDEANPPKKTFMELVQDSRFSFTKPNRIYGFYFDKENGLIFTTGLSSENKHYTQMQKNICTSLKPLIQIVSDAADKELNNYSNTGKLYYQLPPNHPASIFLNLKIALESNFKFFGDYKSKDFHPGIQNHMEVWSKSLADLTHVDEKEAYKFLLKINACKSGFHVAMDSTILLSGTYLQKENHYKEGIDEIISFTEFQKKIEKSIAYMISKFNQVKEVSVKI